MKYLNKREYLGIKEIQYRVRYGTKDALITMKWVSGEYRITAADLSKYDPNAGVMEFPYKRTVKVVDRIEELLKE